MPGVRFCLSCQVTERYLAPFKHRCVDCGREYWTRTRSPTLDCSLACRAWAWRCRAMLAGRLHARQLTQDLREELARA